MIFYPGKSNNPQLFDLGVECIDAEECTVRSPFARKLIYMKQRLSSDQHKVRHYVTRRQGTALHFSALHSTAALAVTANHFMQPHADAQHHSPPVHRKTNHRMPMHVNSRRQFSSRHLKTLRTTTRRQTSTSRGTTHHNSPSRQIKSRHETSTHCRSRRHFIPCSLHSSAAHALPAIIKRRMNSFCLVCRISAVDRQGLVCWPLKVIHPCV